MPHIVKAVIVDFAKIANSFELLGGNIISSVCMNALKYKTQKLDYHSATT